MGFEQFRGKKLLPARQKNRECRYCKLILYTSEVHIHKVAVAKDDVY